MTTNPTPPSIDELIAEARYLAAENEYPPMNTLLVQLADALAESQTELDQALESEKLLREDWRTARAELAQSQKEQERLRATLKRIAEGQFDEFEVINVAETALTPKPNLPESVGDNNCAVVTSTSEVHAPNGTSEPKPGCCPHGIYVEQFWCKVCEPETGAADPQGVLKQKEALCEHDSTSYEHVKCLRCWDVGCEACT